ncbi:hypothetical protein D5272_11285 [bacterium D16-76]|nr:hypothetical protein [bacterium D16-76]
MGALPPTPCFPPAGSAAGRNRMAKRNVLPAAHSDLFFRKRVDPKIYRIQRGCRRAGDGWGGRGLFSFGMFIGIVYTN